MDSSLVSKAKTALHSAAAKAEKVLTDIKADLRNDRGEEKSVSLSGETTENEESVRNVLSANNVFSLHGNLWRELWENAKPIPAVNQTPLYDEDLAVDGIFNLLEETAPADIFQQLFVAALSAGFAIAETAIPIDSESANLFNECKQYVISTCQYELNSENIDNLCQVYATVETLRAHPEAAVTIKKPDNRVNNELRRRFEKFNLNFPGKNKPLFGKLSAKDKVSDHSQPRPLAQFFDSKSSLFMKKSAHASAPSAAAAAESLSSDEDWTIV